MSREMSLLALGVLLTTSCVSGARLSRHADMQQRMNEPQPANPPSPPVWADAYSVEFVVSMPHFFLSQPQGLSIPVKAWWEGEHGRTLRSKIESFGGTDTVIWGRKDNGKKVEYEIHPRIDTVVCWVDNKLVEGAAEQLDGAAQKLGGLLGEGAPILPDLSTYEFVSSLEIDGHMAYAWQQQYREGSAINTYNFYTRASDGAPLKFHMFGTNVIAIGHYDEYIYEFKTYTPGRDNAVFEPPALCTSAAARVRMSGDRGWLSRQLSALMPGARAGGGATAPHALHAASGTDAAHGASYLHWLSSHDDSGRDEETTGAARALPQRAAPVDEAQLGARFARFRVVAARVSAHNADPARTYSMQLGRFADWSEEEVYATMMPDVWRRKRGFGGARAARAAAADETKPGHSDAIGNFKPKMRKSELPKEVDWRGSGADAGVKDQGMCGSCWSFGATAAMEGAWYVETGEKRSFAEQQIIDCAYDFGVNGCDGGDAKPAINYVAAAGGIALEQDYYYHSTADFCWAKNFTAVGKFDGFLQVEPRNEAALMEAVYTKGPLAVGVDPSPDSFLFYKEGVYTSDECDINDLDHQVILMGYGTTDDGQDYWLMKNMWSKFWGNDGYMKIERGKGDCGIATDGNVVVVSEGSRMPGSSSRSLEGVVKW